MRWSWHGNQWENQWILESIMHIWVSEYATEDDQSESGCVPDQQTATRYHKMGLVHSNEHKVYHSYHQTR